MTVNFLAAGELLRTSIGFVPDPCDQISENSISLKPDVIVNLGF